MHINVKNIIFFISASILGAIAYFLINTYFFESDSSEEVAIINNKIERLNKMIVAEQNFSEFYTHKESLVSKEFFGDYISFDDKKIILHIQTKLQATYDLKKLEIKIDSVNKKIIIHKIPEVEVKLYPEVQIYDIDQGLLNTYSSDEIKKITTKAKKKIEKNINYIKIKKEAENQLIENLDDLLFLAKIYKWEVIFPKNYKIKPKD